MVGIYGYFGAFLVSLIGSATIIFPIPSAIFVFGAVAFMNPFWLGIWTGVGATIGEFTGYALGRGGRKVIKKKWGKWVKKIEKAFKTYGGFLVLFVFAATPLPDDVAGIVAGFLKYPMKKWFLAVLFGKIILHMIIAYAGFYGISWVLKYFT